MPVTLRHIQPDAGRKLRQLETGAAELEQAARKSVSPELLPQPAPHHLRGLADKANDFQKRQLSRLHRARELLRSAMKPVAGVLRSTFGLISETAFYALLALGVLCAVALAIMLLAPPA